MSQDSEMKDKPTCSNTGSFSTPSPSQCTVPIVAALKKMDKSKNQFSEFQDRATFEEAVERDREQFEEVLHKKRLDSILNEVKFLEETDWMYPSVESILGFKDDRPIMLASRYESAANLADSHMFRVARAVERTTQ